MGKLDLKEDRYEELKWWGYEVSLWKLFRELLCVNTPNNDNIVG